MTAFFRTMTLENKWYETDTAQDSGFTRMAECRMDVKVLQYIMGHAHIDETMEVYNHIGELTRIENEVAKKY